MVAVSHNVGPGMTRGQGVKDNEIRGLLLQRYYERRREGIQALEPSEFGGRLTKEEINHVSVQLIENGLVGGEVAESMDQGLQEVFGRITAQGVDVVEGSARAPISIHLTQDKSITVTGSQGVVIGDSNTQSVRMEIDKLVQAIDGSSASATEKAEAISKLRAFLGLPLVSTLVGGAITFMTGSAS